MGKDKSVSPSDDWGAVKENAKSVANRSLPPVPSLTRDKDGNFPVSLVLFYQYIEPSWTEPEHKAALNYVINLAKTHTVMGRGRCAPEGLNCTLTGTPQGVRDFCYGLRKWNPAFNETDFKITDGVYYGKRFKALTIRKVQELVAYGLVKEQAPSLNHSKAVHLEADSFHQMMTEDNTVIIDVRNFYESNIGHFSPPEGGAELIDPKMRNSHEFPKWLNAPETKEKLKGKKVMMYCTGGIRCERASALLDTMEKTNDLQTEGVYMVRGGIERYMKTYPDGGFWKGKNYLFDRRFEQVPEHKSEEALEKDVESKCCICDKAWDLYRGQFKCVQPLCKVPVIVCFECADAKAFVKKPPLCPLCVEGYELRNLAVPDVAGQKRKLFGMDPCLPPSDPDDPEASTPQTSAPKLAKCAKKKEEKDPCARIFVGNLPLVITNKLLRGTLGAGNVVALEWITDKTSGAFYGSAFVKMKTVGHAKGILERARGAKGLHLEGAGGRKPRPLRVGFSPPTGGDDTWPPEGFQERQNPPLGHDLGKCRLVRPPKEKILASSK